MTLAHADEYTVLCQRVQSLCEIDLLQYKRPQMERRIRDFVERRGARSLTEYGRRLTDNPGELDAFLDRVTINVSQLWRHVEQWELLRTRLLPTLAARSGTLRAWSAGCSYGAEAYTLAAVARQAVPGARIRIHGTDIDRRMVERAREGRFRAEDARGAPADAIERYFTRLPEGGLEATPELRALVRFAEGDLLRMPIPSAAYELVLCRNTAIYFNPDARDALHERLAASLRRDGVLIVGATERVFDPAACGLELVQPFVYRRIL